MYDDSCCELDRLGNSAVGSGCVVLFFFFKQKTAYEMRISDWSSDVCSSDLLICREVIIIRPFAPCLQRNAMPSPDFAVLDRRMREKEKRRLLTFHFGKKQGRAGIA